jgi:hypothetical protein
MLPAPRRDISTRGDGSLGEAGTRRHDPEGASAGSRSVESTSETRDLPVRAAVVAIRDEGAWGNAEPDQIAERTGLPREDVTKALWRLAAENPPFFRFSDDSTFGGREIRSISMPTRHGQRIVGAWPDSGVGRRTDHPLLAGGSRQR